MSTLRTIHLPAEVLSSILKHLPQDDLRKASGASSDFYHAAHDAGLCLHRRVHSERKHTLDTFAAIVQHATAQRHTFRLGLTMAILRRNEGNNLGVPSLQHIWDVLRRAIPFLVTLGVKLYSPLVGATFIALDAPAPHLCTLSILILDDQANPAPIPTTLFGGKSPRLRTVRLNGPVLPLAPARIAAWSRVRELSVCVYHEARQLPIAAYFPALCNLGLQVLPRQARIIVDLAGLVLDSLIIDNDLGAPVQYARDDSRPRPRIRTVDDICKAAHYDESLWPATDVPLTAHFQQTVYSMDNGTCTPYDPSPLDFLSPYDTSLRVQTGEIISINSAAESCDWRITQYTRPAPPTAPGPLRALGAFPPLSRRLTSLTIDEALVVRLLETACTLEALLELHVDCTVVPTPPPAWPSLQRLYGLMMPELVSMVLTRPVLSCPVLERAAFFASGIATPVSVDCDKIAALGLLRSDARVALVLARVIVDYGAAVRPSLQDVFSSVHVSNSDRYVPKYYHPREDNLRFSMAQRLRQSVSF